ncbi:cellulose-binding protein, partial [Methylobacterium sp. WL103]
PPTASPPTASPPTASPLTALPLTALPLTALPQGRPAYLARGRALPTLARRARTNPQRRAAGPHAPGIDR